MSRDPDSPYDACLAQLVGIGMPDNSGTLSRKLMAKAAKRRLVARQMRDAGQADGAMCADHDAAYLERHAERLRSPQEAIGGSLTTGIGGEVMAEEPGLSCYQAMLGQSPDMLSAEATETRMTLTANVSDAALTLALDAAESVGARDALEQMAVHEIAVVHTLAMILAAKAHGFAAAINCRQPEGRQQMQAIEAARMGRMAARLCETAQRGMLALARRRNGGHQRITIQHVTVQDGGQAMVTGTIRPRRPK